MHESDVSNNLVGGDDSAKNGTQLSFIEESCIIKELVLKLIFRYDQFISSKYMLLSASLKCLNSSRTYAKQIQEEKALIANIPMSRKTCHALPGDTSLQRNMHFTATNIMEQKRIDEKKRKKEIYHFIQLS